MKDLRKASDTTFLKKLILLISICLLTSIILNMLVLIADHLLITSGIPNQNVNIITKGMVAILSLTFSTIVSLHFGSKLLERISYFLSSLIFILAFFILPWIILLPLILDGLIFP